MKKLFCLFLSVNLVAGAAFAKSVIGQAETSFSTAAPKKEFSVKLTESLLTNDEREFKEGTVIRGTVIKINNPTRGKRNATFEFVPCYYTYDGVTNEISNKDFSMKVKPYTKPDAKQTAMQVAETGAGVVANHFVPFLSQGLSFAKGIRTKANDDNRFKSGVIQVYKDSPVSYVEKGSHIKIRANDYVKLILDEE
ncbi:MAG: hypothetical protein ACI4CY_02830 [Candidatus Gastranaerophilaceae bacterium]